MTPHTHTPMLTLPDTLHREGGLGRGLRPPPAAECDGLRAVTGQGVGPLMAPSGLELGATGLFGSPGLVEKPGAGVPVLGPTSLVEAAANPQGEQTPASPHRSL